VREDMVNTRLTCIPELERATAAMRWKSSVVRDLASPEDALHLHGLASRCSPLSPTLGGLT